MPAEGFLVVGGSGGIGAAVCRELAARGRGCWVGFHRDRRGAEALAEALGTETVPLDLAQPDTLGAALDALPKEPSAVAGVVLAASPRPELVPFARIGAEALERRLRADAVGAQQLIAQAVRRWFRKRRGGTVVGVLSEAMGEEGRAGLASLGDYVIGKYALAGVLAAAAREYPWLRVRTVRPGFTETPMLDAFDERFVADLRERGLVAPPETVAAEIVDQLLAGPEPA